jgi:hypothetical protein
VTKRALEQLRANKENRPIFVIDDVHKSYRDGHFPQETEDLISWALEMHIRGLLLLKMLSSESRIIPQLQQGSQYYLLIPLLLTSHFLFAAISGMSLRGRPARINYVDVFCEKLPQKHLWNILTDEEIQEVVNTVGGHLGDVGLWRR